MNVVFYSDSFMQSFIIKFLENIVFFHSHKVWFLFSLFPFCIFSCPEFCCWWWWWWFYGILFFFLVPEKKFMLINCMSGIFLFFSHLSKLQVSRWWWWVFFFTNGVCSSESFFFIFNYFIMHTQIIITRIKL